MTPQELKTKLDDSRISIDKITIEATFDDDRYFVVYRDEWRVRSNSGGDSEKNLRNCLQVLERTRARLFRGDIAQET